MINIKECIKKYNLKIKRITINNNYYIIEGNKKYLLKKKNNHLKELIDYFKSINYNYYLSPINSSKDSYELYIIDEKLIDNPNNKEKEIIISIAKLHKKSIIKKSLNNNELKKIYKSINKRIEKISIYYLSLQDRIEECDFPKIDYYVLLLEISKFHKILRLAKEKLEEWYSNKNVNLRTSQLIGNTSKNNFISGEKKVFIDFQKSKKSLLIYDLLALYRNEWNNLDFDYIISTYEKKNQLTLSEKQLLDVLICIPKKIKLVNKSTYDNIVNTHYEIEYINKVFKHFLEKNKENQKTNKNELSQKY